MGLRFARAFAIYSLISAVIHFTLETWYTIQFGQSWLGLAPDYISVALMILGGVLVIRDVKAVGVLCGAWGFAFCLNYRAWAWRLQEMLDGSSTTLIDNTMYVLSFTLILSCISFMISLLFCLPARNQSSQ